MPIPISLLPLQHNSRKVSFLCLWVASLPPTDKIARKVFQTDKKGRVQKPCLTNPNLRTLYQPMGVCKNVLLFSPWPSSTSIYALYSCCLCLFHDVFVCAMPQYFELVLAMVSLAFLSANLNGSNLILFCPLYS